MSKRGRTPGKALNEDIRICIIDSIVRKGGDYLSGFFVGNFSEIGRHFNVSGQTVKNV
jgi:hypothetical protein